MRPLLSFLILTFLASCRHATGPSTHDVAFRDSVLAEANKYVFSQPDKAERMLTDAQGKISDSASYYRLEIFRSTAMEQQGRHGEYQKCLQRVLDWCKRTPGNDSIAGEAWNHKGVNAWLEGDNEMAMEHYKRAYEYFHSGAQTAQFISTCINLADIMVQTGHLPDAASYYREALFVADSLNMHASDMSIYSGLAQIYMELENYPLAHIYFDRAAPLVEDKDLQAQLFFHITLGNCLFFEKRYPEALKQFEIAKEKALAIGTPIALVQSQCNLGEVLLMLNRRQEAEIYVNNVLKIMDKHSELFNSQVKFYVNSLAAELHLVSGNVATARKHLFRAHELRDNSSPRYLMLHYQRLTRYASANNLWERALHYKERAEAYEDTLRNRQVANNVAEISERYRRDTTVLRQRIALADVKHSNSQLRLSIALAAMVLAIGVLAVVIRNMLRRRREQQLERERMEQITELRMDIVRNRVSPHYVFNVLGAVIPRLQSYPELTMPLELLVDVLRGNLLASGRISVCLADEVALVKNFTRLWAYSKGERPRVEWNIDEDIDLEASQVPTMCLQIPVENALKHAFPVPTDDSLISIRISLDHDCLRLVIEDNGCGFNPGKVGQTRRDTGTGLRLLARTLTLLNPYNRQPASFCQKNLAPPQHGTRSELLIPTGYIFTFGRSPAEKKGI